MIDKIPKYLSVGYRIASIRRMKGLSQTKFANSIGISQSFLSELEKGLTKPTMPILYALEWKHGFRLEWILTGDEPMYLNSLSPPITMPMIGYETSDRVLMIWINRLIRIFEEGDKAKIDLLKAQLRALDPQPKK